MDQNLTNEDIIENLEADFDSFLARKDYDSARTVEDNVVSLGNFELAYKLCMKRCAAIMKDRMTLPAGYGEEKSVLEVMNSAVSATLSNEERVW